MSSVEDRRLRILLVEDEALLREIAMRELEDAGFLVIEAGTGDEAVTCLDRAPDLLFTDIRLPGSLDGWSVAEHFRAAFPEAPIIYATGYSTTHQPLDRSMFFRKPYKMRQVIAGICALTGRPMSGD